METSTVPKSDQTLFILPEDRLYLATRTWLIFLQGLFKSRPRGNMRWDDNEDETELLIHDQGATQVPQNNTRPIITTARGVAQATGLSLSGVASQDLSGENKVFSDIIGSTMTFNCIAREGIQAQALAYTIMTMIPVFKESIQRLGKMHWIGNNIQVTPEVASRDIYPGSSFPEWRVVRVIVPFQLVETIRVSHGSHNVLREVTLHMEESA